MTQQSLANHARYVPGYHYFTAALLLLNLGYALVAVVRHPAAGTVVGLAVAVALVMIFYYARAFALRVQDRVIRLEERLRLERVLPADLRGRIGELTTGQLVALRFAPDDELPDLARRVLEGSLRGREAIKREVRNWRKDDLRA